MKACEQEKIYLTFMLCVIVYRSDFKLFYIIEMIIDTPYLFW